MVSVAVDDIWSFQTCLLVMELSAWIEFGSWVILVFTDNGWYLF